MAVLKAYGFTCLALNVYKLKVVTIYDSNAENQTLNSLLNAQIIKPVKQLYSTTDVVEYERRKINTD